MASFLQIPFRVRRMAQNGFNACRYSEPYRLDVDKDFKPIKVPAITPFLANFQRMCPELEDKQKYQLVYPDGSGDNLLLETDADLEIIIYLNKKQAKAGKFILLHILEKSQTNSTGVIASNVKRCRECDDCLTAAILFHCSQCADYNLCGTCVTEGKHPQHLIVRAGDFKIKYEATDKQLNHKCIEEDSYSSDYEFSEPARTERELKKEQKKQLKQLAKLVKNKRDSGDFIGNSRKQASCSPMADEKLQLSAVPVVRLNRFQNGKRVDDGSSSRSVQNPTESNAATPVKSQSKEEDRSPTAKTSDEDLESLDIPHKFIPRHPDPLIDGALEKMLAMGFKDDGGWLTRLLEVKKGDIAKVLNVLHLS